MWGSGIRRRRDLLLVAQHRNCYQLLSLQLLLTNPRFAAIYKTCRAAHRDVRRFPSRQDAESENPLERLSCERLLPREKGPFFWLLFFGPLQRKVTRSRSEWKPWVEMAASMVSQSLTYPHCTWAVAVAPHAPA